MKRLIYATVLAMTGVVVPAQAAPPDQPPPTGQDRTITLITGDRVVLRGGDLRRMSIVPGTRRKQVKFHVTQVRDRLTVMPLDLAPLVAAGKLDGRFFDIRGLIRDGFDDARTSRIPMLVRYHGRSEQAALTRSGAAVTRALPVIGGAAVRVEKAAVSGFLDEVVAGGIDRIWLDGRRRPVLDRSTAQIGAPAAWRQGLTGRGTTVAVIDTGVDGAHPDLKGKVADAKDFVGGPPGDQVGHGTHVASTIAGTGAASNGRFRGVAPQAKVLDGRVCYAGGCPESAILAGMEWATREKRAKVVNLSLGGPDFDGPDPLEEAVDRLTAETGALFVIAAGNDGPYPETVGSPGNAKSALTVGAVDRRGELAEFSSRGPRRGNGAIKPDITAPGVGIVAARAKDAVIGTAIGRYYLAMSGTSMATPHVAGAAALLVQRHQGWQAGQLKAALMASARPHPKQSVFEQGAGRVDVARAVGQRVVAEPATAEFGTVRWPHTDDTPAVRRLTYRNSGTKPVTLSLRSRLVAPDGTAAPSPALRLSASTVTVPAGGTATVDVVSDTRHSGPDGRYAGQVLAIGGNQSVVTPVAVDKEVESYDVSVRHVGPDGKPAAGQTALFGIDVVAFAVLRGETPKTRLPRGEYVLDGIVSLFVPEDRILSYTLVQPRLRIDGDQNLVIDARRTRPMSTTVPRPDVQAFAVEYGQTSTGADGTPVRTVLIGVGGGLEDSHVGQLGPGSAGMASYVASHWGVPDKDGTMTNTPVTYNVMQTRKGGFFDGYSRTVRQEELAEVRSRHHAHSDRKGAKYLAWAHPDVGDGVLSMGHAMDLPSAVSHYVESGDTTWQGTFEELVPDPEYPEFLIPVSGLQSAPRGYPAGRVTAERWNAAVLAPGIGVGVATRTGDEMLIGLAAYVDADGHFGGSVVDAGSMRLYRDGKLAGSLARHDYLSVGRIPAGRATFRLVSSADRASSLPGLSTRSELDWTFRSHATGKRQLLPLRTVRFLPPVDDRNTVRREPRITLPFRLDAQPGAVPPVPRRVAVRVSGDDGTTWLPAEVRRTGDGAYVAVFTTPIDARHVSLRAEVSDRDGTTLRQTVIRAFAVG